MWVCREPGAARVFPYNIQFPNTNSAATCLNRCSLYGYAAAGMEVRGYPSVYRASTLPWRSSAMNAGAETSR